MIYTALTNKALRIACAAHAGQLDKAGVPYICHPLHLAEQMTDEVTTCTALLHDVVEDTSITLAQLAADFPPAVIRALSLLTHDDAVPYADYVRAIAADPVAKAVKLADLAHNSDESRFAGCPPAPAEKLDARRQKYAEAKCILLGEE